ncbi:hypothetical protein Q5W88_01325 [Shouchella clausii]|uniref:hypothetical protein n=1 Tax=Shouchella clausii TaxID=79880 RepID=UPI0026F417FB|nr:hypothetical protein [Shouchella clausii]MDO7281774.1 hypothetical protein [Shouchella clausii]MDO7301869.1 hypothetical protein [Shouchella clausii]
MWIVVRIWNYYESDVNAFETLEDAEKFFDEWLDANAEKIYLAKVEKVKEEGV